MNFEQTFDESYHRVMTIYKENPSFFDIFYEIFFSASPEIEQYFAHTDMQRQKEIMSKSFYNLFIFYGSDHADDYLSKIAATHSKKGLNIRPELYDTWLESIIKTVAHCDPEFDNDIELAWRLVLSAGIVYMKFKYDHD